MLKFTHNKLRVVKNYSLTPVLKIRRIFFSTENKEWPSQLFGAYLIIKIARLNPNEVETGSHTEQLPLSFYITPSHKQPALEINRIFKYPNLSVGEEENRNNWKIEITLKNVNLKHSESVSIQTLDSKYIFRRVDDWQKRVSDVIDNISSWIKDEDFYSLRNGRSQIMHEGLMKDFDIPPRPIATVDILKEEKIVMSVKPFGLWIIGSNGRIDFLTANGNYILVDHSEKLKPPNWKLYSMTTRLYPIDFNKDNFLKILAS